MALPTRARASFTHSQSLTSESSHKPLILIHQRVNENQNHRKLTKLITCTTVLPNNVTMSHAIDRWVMVESSDKTWSTEEGNDKWLQHSCLENPMNSMKRKKGMILKDEIPRLLGAQYATREEQRNSSKRNEEDEPKWKQCPAVDMSGAVRTILHRNLEC